MAAIVGGGELPVKPFPEMTGIVWTLPCISGSLMHQIQGDGHGAKFIENYPDDAVDWGGNKRN
jgi:hypothetical protein